MREGRCGGIIRGNRICLAQLHVSFYNILTRGGYVKGMMMFRGDDLIIQKYLKRTL
jgi:hypothetical protein